MTNADIIRHVIRSESTDYTNRPDDRGGPTHFGVTLKALQRHNPNANEEDVKALTELEATALLAQDYILEPGFQVLLDDYLRLVTVDAAVNHGPTVAKKLVQRALGVKDDGVWGDLTRAAIVHANQRKLAVRVCTMRARLYAAIVAGNLEDRDKDGIPDNVEMIRGWTNRNMSLIEEVVAA